MIDRHAILQAKLRKRRSEIVSDLFSLGGFMVFIAVSLAVVFTMFSIGSVAYQEWRRRDPDWDDLRVVYVDSTEGDDLEGNGSINKPYQSIFMATLNDADVVFFNPGEYFVPAHLDLSGKALIGGEGVSLRMEGNDLFPSGWPSMTYNFQIYAGKARVDTNPGTAEEERELREWREDAASGIDDILQRHRPWMFEETEVEIKQGETIIEGIGDEIRLTPPVTDAEF